MGNFTNWLRDVLLERGGKIGWMKSGSSRRETERTHRESTYSLLRPLDDKAVTRDPSDLPVAHRYSA